MGLIVLLKIKGFKNQVEELEQGSFWKNGGEQEVGSGQSVFLG